MLSGDTDKMKGIMSAIVDPVPATTESCAESLESLCEQNDFEHLARAIRQGASVYFVLTDYEVPTS